MLLHKGCEKRLAAHLAKLDTMIEDLRLIARKGDERVAGASKAWNKSENGKKFVKDLDTVEWLANQYLDMRRALQKEIRTTDERDGVPAPAIRKDVEKETASDW